MNPQDFRNHLSTYASMSDLVKNHSYEDILTAAAALANIPPENLARHPMGGYSKGMTSGAYQFTLKDLIKNIEHYDWLYSRLEDDASRMVFANLIGYRLFPAQSFLKAAYDGEHPQYFDKNIVKCGKDEVFVDCGGFTGDTAEEFIRQFGQYKQIYVYEPSPSNIQTCRDNLAGYRNITVRQCGVGEKTEILSMQGSGASSTFMGEEKSPDSQGIRIVSLDEDIQETITFLKMDIEGAEISALLGAKRHIRDDFPKLAVCTYHIVSDMWEIPRLIDIIHPGYRFFIRHYDFPQNWETVIYAVPPEEKRPPARRQKKALRVASTPFDAGWYNPSLTKDCGVIPYLLHKNHRCESVMFGAKMEKEYSNLQYVPGLKMEFLPDVSLQSKADYLAAEAKNIDCLLLYGCYHAYIPLADIYKQRNPQGKICLALDANSGWMDRIQWTEPDFCRFMDQCDVITTAGHTMQRHLSKKWPWKIEFIPNGFYNFSSRKWTVDFEKKKNVILTVGRLGTPQKATNILLEAFAKIAEKIPDWELRLAGSVEPDFEPYLAQFREKFPELRERVKFLGSILDRDKLYDEYLTAKVFALPSNWEGAANVVAEALYAGNAIAITKLDEYEDAIDSGRCGMASEIGDVDGFAEILLCLCQNERLEELCRRAYAYAQETFDMERVVAGLYRLIFDGEER